jgi:NAD(P)-dependent dehydrogenase (short-subunit alcohol dehydrogenase family)
MATNGHHVTSSSPRQDDRLQGRIAVITGSSSGLGRAMALKFASAGARIVCADLRPDARPMAAHKSPPTPTHELINETYKGDNAIFVQTDATDEEAIKALIAEAVEWAGRLDSMFNAL